MLQLVVVVVQTCAPFSCVTAYDAAPETSPHCNVTCELPVRYVTDTGALTDCTEASGVVFDTAGVGVCAGLC